MNIHEDEKDAIRAWAHDSRKTGLLALYGPKGVGKKAACLAALGQNITSVPIYENDFFQFRALLDVGSGSRMENESIEFNQHHLDNYFSRILNIISHILKNDEFILIENMERCDDEHRRILGQIQTYCQINSKKCNIVLSFNVSPDKMLDHCVTLGISESISFGKIDNEIVSELAKQKIASSVDDETAEMISSRVALLTSGLISCLPLVFEALEKARFLTKVGNSYKLIPGVAATSIPISIGDIYERQLSLLTKQDQKLLVSALPFGRDIHLNLLKDIIQEHNLEDTCSEIINDSTLIDGNQYKRSNALFDCSYRLTGEHARSAIESVSETEATSNLQTKIRRFLLSKQGESNAKEPEPDDYIDQYKTLRYLSAASSAPMDRVNPEIVRDLMGILFLGGYYARVCEVARSYFNNSKERYNFASKHEPLIPELYIESLYLLNEYEEAISIFVKHHLRSPRSILVCARAHYAIDSLKEAKRLATEAARAKSTEAEAHLLLASIANWEDNDRICRKEFALAIKAIEKLQPNVYDNSIAEKIQDHNIHYARQVLYRDYLQFLPKKMKEIAKEVDERCQYYADHSMDSLCISRVQAEILHNHGTELIKKKATREKGIAFLTAANRYFEIWCDSDQYYVQNSLGMAACLNGDFKSGLEIFERLQPPAHSPFCVLAIRNNEIATLLALNERARAKEKCNELFEYIRQLSRINEASSFGSQDKYELLSGLTLNRPDVKRQLKHYCLNCARLESEDALDIEWVRMANKISKEESSSNYLVEKHLYDHSKPKLRKPKKPALDSIDWWFFTHKIFLCEVMFWG